MKIAPSKRMQKTGNLASRHQDEFSTSFEVALIWMICAGNSRALLLVLIGNSIRKFYRSRMDSGTVVARFISFHWISAFQCAPAGKLNPEVNRAAAVAQLGEVINSVACLDPFHWHLTCGCVNLFGNVHDTRIGISSFFPPGNGYLMPMCCVWKPCLCCCNLLRSPILPRWPFTKCMFPVLNVSCFCSVFTAIVDPIHVLLMSRWEWSKKLGC